MSRSRYRSGDPAVPWYAPIGPRSRCQTIVPFRSTATSPRAPNDAYTRSPSVAGVAEAWPFLKWADPGRPAGTKRLPKLPAVSPPKPQHRHTPSFVVRGGEKNAIAPHDRRRVASPGHRCFPQDVLSGRPGVHVAAACDEALPGRPAPTRPVPRALRLRRGSSARPRPARRDARATTTSTPARPASAGARHRRPQRSAVRTPL